MNKLREIKEEYFNIVFFPVTAEKLTGKQIDYIMRNYELSISEIEQLTKDRLDEKTVIDLCKDVVEEQKYLVYKIAKELCEIEYTTYKQLNCLAIIGEALGIEQQKTGYMFNLYDENERRKYEVNKVVLNYSIVSAAVSLFPFSFIKEFFITSPIQILMVNNISNIYDFELDAKKIIEMVSGSLVINLIIKGISSLITSFLSIKFPVRASMSFVSTYTIGLLAKSYIEADGQLSEEMVNRIIENASNEGKALFNQFKDYILKNKDIIVEEFKKKQKKQA